MRYGHLMVIRGLLVSSAVAAVVVHLLLSTRSSGTPRPNSVDNACHIDVAAPVVDLGTLRPDQSAVARFRICNVGNKQLHIQKIMTSCGCTETAIDSSSIAPKGFAWASVTFHPEGFWRNVSREVIILSDDCSRPALPLEITAYVLVGARIDTDRMDLGDGYFGESLPGKLFHALEDSGGNDPPVSVTGDVEGLSIEVSRWQAHDELRRSDVEIGTTRLSGALGVTHRNLVVHVGSSGFPLALTYGVKPMVRVLPTVAAVLRLDSKDAGQSLRLVATTRNIIFEAPFSVYLKCVPSLRTTSPRDAELSVRPLSAKDSDDFDVVVVQYTILPERRQEKVSIPVEILAGSGHASARD